MPPDVRESIGARLMRISVFSWESLMPTFRSCTLARAALAAIGLLAAIQLASPADAAVMLRAQISTNAGTSFGSTTTIIDGQASDLNPAPGDVSALITIGSLNISAGATGLPVIPRPDLTASFSVYGTAAVDTILRLLFTQTDNPNSVGTNLLSAFAVTTLSGASSITFTSAAQRNNAAFGMNQVLTTRSFSTTDGFTSINFFAPSTNPLQPNFSTTMRVDIPFAAGTFAFVGGTMASTNVPEPMALALFGAGLLGLAACRRRRG
jgi:hypothetical protein